jgi:uncharacterized protein (TIGR00251 family)
LEAGALKVKEKRPVSRRDSLQTLLKVKLIPRSSRNQVVGKEDDTYRIKITAPPVEGKANHLLIDYLSGILEVPKGNVQIVSGESSRMKTLRIAGISLKEIHDKIAAQFYKTRLRR